MSTFAVFRREWIGRRNLFLLALGMGFLYLIGVRFDPEMRAGHEKAAVIAVATSILLPWAVAALFGATMVGKDLEERRFGFLLNQPIRLGEIFFGKVAAGLGMAMTFGFLACLPSLLLGGLWRLVPLVEAARLLGLSLAGGIVLLLLCHVLSIQLRSRSLWLVLDLAAWSAFLWGARSLSLKLIAVGAFPEMLHLWLILLGVVTVGLGVAGYLQVAEGRADLQRGHRWVSLTLAMSMGLALLIGWAQVAWVLKSRPDGPRVPQGSVRIR